MIVLASGFLTFVGFLFAGLLALGVTAALDRQVGKERALFLFTGVLLLFTLWQCTPEPVKASGRPRPENVVSKVLAKKLDVAGSPFARPDLALPRDARNPFQKQTDTKPLAPITLSLPPWLPLATELPPTVPGPAPSARRILRGDFPHVTMGDGSKIPDIPEPTFQDYTPKPEDVFDWIMSGSKRLYIYILSIRDGGTTYEDGKPGFLQHLFALADRATGWEGYQVEYAIVGSEDAAAKHLQPTELLKAKSSNKSTSAATQNDHWYPRRTVEVLYHEALRRHGLPWDPHGTQDIASLEAAAHDMAEIGKTGKEQREGWRRATTLLKIALDQARQRATPTVRAELLQQLVEAYRGLRDEEAVLTTLSEYARTSPTRPEPWLWLGQLHLEALGVPEEALLYFDTAISKSTSRNNAALIGRGDCLTDLGRNQDALEAYRQAAGDPEARVRIGEAQLRLGLLDDASTTLTPLVSEGATPRALVAMGAVEYAKGNLDEARKDFEAAATSTGPGALEMRAQACYDLGLTCLRQGQGDASVAAFDACTAALEMGSLPGRTPDETVSPTFGHALVELFRGNEAGMRDLLQKAREEAPQVAYHEMLAGMVASRGGDDATAVRTFERALKLAASYPEIDGWMAKTRLDLAKLALGTGTPIKEAAQDFDAATRFAARASESEAAADPKAVDALLREAWIRLNAEQLLTRERFEAARATTDKILNRIDREQPAALAIRAYCDYRLAEFGGGGYANAYDPCIHDFQEVLNKVQDPASPWKVWRDYADETLREVKHWQNLEEKTVVFEEGGLPADWKADEGAKVKQDAQPDGVHIRGRADRDGTLDAPTFTLTNDDLFRVSSFEELRMKIKIPLHDASGGATNTITFGVQVQRQAARGANRAKQAGIGLFVDHGKLALRVGGSQDDTFKDGEIHRLEPEQEWPSDDWVELRIVRTDEKEGTMSVTLDSNLDDDQPGQEIGRFTVGGFKGSMGSKAELWIGGFSNQTQEWNVEIKDIRIIRKKS